MIKIQWFGHSMWKFSISDTEIIVDPFTDIGYPLPKNLTADIVVSTHNHFDHNNFSLIKGNYKKIIEEGDYEYKDIHIKAIQVWHDKNHGLERGKNLLVKIQSEEFSLLHCGDLGHIPDDYTIKQLGKIDMIFIPIGGTYTINAKEAKTVIDLIKPKIIFPMHYKTPAISFDITSLEPFISLFDKNEIYYHNKNVIELSRSELDKYKIIVMNYV